MRRTLAVTAVVSTLLLAACGGGNKGDDAPATTGTPSATTGQEPETTATPEGERGTPASEAQPPVPDSSSTPTTTPETPATTPEATSTPEPLSQHDPRAELMEACADGEAVSDPESFPSQVEDCALLLEARDTLVGDGTPLNWSADRPMGEWTGIAIADVPRRVFQIYLTGGLRGEIPGVLAELGWLGVLALYDHDLSGGIPPELAGLPALQVLALVNSGLTGEIPPSMGDLPLRYVDLSGNQLTGAIPPEMGRSGVLQVLNLSGNELTGAIPPEMGQLPLLREINLAENQLSGAIPQELELWNLQVLNLGGNQLSGGIPPELGQLRILEEINLAGNQLSGGIPPELGQLWKLVRLNLAGNELSGPIPPELGKLSRLSQLDLGGNQLSGEIPPEMGQLWTLVRLNLAGNELSGPIPPELGMLVNVTRMALSGNRLTGDIPEELTNLRHLISLSLRDNDLGCMPAALLQTLPDVTTTRDGVSLPPYEPTICPALSDDEAIDACSNGIAVPEPELNSGLINDCAVLLTARAVLVGDYSDAVQDNEPLLNWRADVPLSEWDGVTLSGTPRRVTELGVKSTSVGGRGPLVGTIPPELGLLSKLEVLDLSDGHYISGPIPAELGQLSALKILNLGSNPIGGTIPAELGALSNLEMLWMERHRFTGNLPPELGRLGKLQRLTLISSPYDEEMLTGEIPSELGQLRSLALLDLSRNGFTGSIPPALGSLPNLSILNLSENRLSGSIPPELGHLSNLTGLDLAENALTGAIPPELGNLASLWGLYLNNNQLTGDIPPELGSIDGLTMVNLSNNQLTGGIPRKVAELPELELLNLRNNRLTGEIPSGLASAKFHSDWAGLWLGGNQWEGCIPLALRPLLERTDYTSVSDLRRLGLRYCQCLPPPAEAPAPELTVGVDGIPYLRRQETSVAGTYRLTFNLVIDLPPGAMFRVGEQYPGGEREGGISVTIFDGASASTLTIDSFTGYEYSRSVVDGPEDCENNASRLFDQIVASAREQAPYTPPEPETIEHLEGAALEGGRTYWLSEDAYLVFDVPEGARFETAGWFICADPGRCYSILVLIDAETDSRLPIDEETGEPGRTVVVTDEGRARGIDAVFDQVIASTRQHPPLPSCDRAETASDCAILLEARDTLAGDGELNWSADIPVSHWWGVTVDRWTGRVTEVHPASRVLTGRIPAVLGELSELTLLWLGPNSQLTGEIPPELGRLSQLETLYLAMNRLTGGIPAELGQLSRLKTLNLEGNNLTGEIPPEIAALPRLSLLQIDGNQLKGCLPEPFWYMSIKMGRAESNPDLRRCEEDQ